MSYETAQIVLIVLVSLATFVLGYVLGRIKYIEIDHTIFEDYKHDIKVAYKNGIRLLANKIIEHSENGTSEVVLKELVKLSLDEIDKLEIGE